jgi:hypothetical protein
MRKRIFLTVAAGLSLAACATLWDKPGGTPAEFETDKSACSAQAYQMYPPMMQQVTLIPGHYTPVQTICNGFGNMVTCNTTGGDYVPPVTSMVDENQGNRNNTVRSCLVSDGWNKTGVRVLGLFDVKN